VREDFMLLGQQWEVEKDEKKERSWERGRGCWGSPRGLCRSDAHSLPA